MVNRQASIGLSPGFLLHLALALLLLPLPWLAAMILSAIWHEVCHWCAIRLCGGHCGRLSLSSFAARMPLPQLSHGQELFCALAGPASTVFLLPLLPWIPRVVLCSAAQSCYNLLPVYPLDGGRAMSCLLAMLFPPLLTAKILQILQMAVTAGVVFLGIYAAFFLKLGLSPIFLATVLLIQIKSAKNPLQSG